MGIPNWRRPHPDRPNNVWDGPLTSSEGTPKTLEDFPDLTPKIWDDIRNGRLVVGATRYERPGATDLIMWLNGEGHHEYYVEISTDIEHYKKRVRPGFGVDVDDVAMIAAFSAQQWNDLMWFYVHGKGYSPKAAQVQVRKDNADFLKLVIQGAMTILGSKPSVIKPGGVGSRPSRVTPTSRRGDPTHVYKELDGISSGIKAGAERYQEFRIARDEAGFKGKYSVLNYWFYYPSEKLEYGNKKDWDTRYAKTRYAGGRFNVPAGYWVWIRPFYFIWDKRS